MFKEVYNKIKEYETIVIARHVGVDPDAMASQMALKESVQLTFPEKKVFAVGTGSTKFLYLGKLDKLDDFDKEKSLLIILDTPDKKRVDIEDIDTYPNKIKIDHHPHIETFCDIEIIDDTSSSACQLVAEFLYETDMVKNTDIMRKLYQGMISDTNRFLFLNEQSKISSFKLAAKMMEDYDIDTMNAYADLYMRPLREVRFQGYIEQNLSITENGVGYIKITDEVMNKFKTDASAAGNMINNLNYIEEVLVWLTVSEDLKNEVLKVSIRSRGPVINKIAEKYNGGGHKMASGARLKTDEEIILLVNDLDRACAEYLGGVENEN